MAKPRLSDEQVEFIRANFDKMSCEALRKKFNERYNENFKVTAFHYHTKRLGLEKWKEHVYTSEQEAFLKENASLMTREELTDAFNKKFNAHVKCDAIEQRCWQKKYGRSTDGQFHKGSVPWEKTKGGREEYVKTIKGGNSTSFRKGDIRLEKPIGTVSERAEDVYIKTKDGWKTKRRAVWENHNGKIERGYRLFSVDGNKKNDDIENIRVVNHEVMSIIVSNRWHDKGAEIFDAGVQYAKLYITLKESGYDIKNEVKRIEKECE